jgi:hypothetical protein
MASHLGSEDGGAELRREERLDLEAPPLQAYLPRAWHRAQGLGLRAEVYDVNA